MPPVLSVLRRDDKVLKPYTTQRGKPGVTDANLYSYVENGVGKVRTRYRCSKRSCHGTLVRDNATGNMVGKELPEHNHENKLMKTKAMETEKNVVRHFATVPGTTAASVLQEISSNMLASDFPGM